MPLQRWHTDKARCFEDDTNTTFPNCWFSVWADNFHILQNPGIGIGCPTHNMVCSPHGHDDCIGITGSKWKLCLELLFFSYLRGNTGNHLFCTKGLVDFTKIQIIQESPASFRTITTGAELAHEWWVVSVFYLYMEEKIFGGQPGLEKGCNETTSLQERHQ